MPLKVMGVVEQRLAVLQEPGWSGRSVREVCARHGISPDTFYAWKRRYELAGLDGLVPRSRRPLVSPRQLDPAVEDRILALRKDFGWGPRKIRDALRREGLAVPAISTVQQALARRGVLTPRQRRQARRPEGHRFQRAASNQLWQIDGTQHHLRDGTPFWVVDLIDDHSRFCVGALAGPGLTGQLAWAALRAAVAAYGAPEQLLSDNGLCFTGRLNQFVVSFERRVAAAGIGFCHARPYHPQTCGKVERLHQTAKPWVQARRPATLTQAQQALEEFRTHYNQHRPHQSLDGQVPAQRFTPGAGMVLPAIEIEPADACPPGCAPRKASTAGTITYRHRALHLGQRWADVTVGVAEDGPRLHVFYGSSLIATFTGATR